MTQLEAIGAGGVEPLRKVAIPSAVEVTDDHAAFEKFWSKWQRETWNYRAGQMPDDWNIVAKPYMEIAWQARALLAGVSAPAAQAMDMPDFDLRTSEGGRGFVAWYFANVLHRYDYEKYITTRLAADFACALASWLRDGKPRVESHAAPAAVAVPDERAAFEAWADARKEDSIYLPKFADGTYIYDDTHAAWEAWQARAALATTKGNT